MENLEVAKNDENSENIIKTIPYAPANHLEEEQTQLPDLDKAYQDDPEKENKKEMLDAIKNGFSILTDQSKSSQTRFNYVRTTAELFVGDGVRGEGSEIVILDSNGNQTKKTVYPFFTDMAAKGTKYDILDNKTEWGEPKIETGINGNTRNTEEQKFYRIKTLYVTLSQ